VRDLLWTMSNDYADQGNYQSAYLYMKKYTGINDSIRNAEFSRKLAVLQMHFNTQRKDAELEKLKGKVENPLQSEGNSLTMVLIVIIVVLFVGGVVFSVIAQKRFSALHRQMESMQQAQFNKNTGTNFPRN
jgi:flagellar biosynthesis/type III secretory pathway M-ring protein FliF/YscJ